MKKFFCLCLVMVLCVFSSTAFAGGGGGGGATIDDTGYFSIDAVTVDDAAWDFGDIPEITMGETYSVDMGVSYAVADSGWSQDTYYEGVSAEIQLPWLAGFGPIVWSAIKSSPDSTTTSAGGQVDKAYWSLSGDLVVPVNPLYLGTRMAGLTLNTTNGDTTQVDFEIRFADVDAAPVPEPSTILLLGIGLLGIVGFSRRKKKA